MMMTRMDAPDGFCRWLALAKLLADSDAFRRDARKPANCEFGQYEAVARSGEALHWIGRDVSPSRANHLWK